jgi:hypothetical protein
MRWLAIGIVAAVTASAVAIAGVYYAQDSEEAPLDPDRIFGSEDFEPEDFGFIVTVPTLGPPPDCTVPEVLPSDPTLVAQAVGGVTVGLPPGVVLEPSSPAGGSFVASLGGVTYAITVLDSVGQYAIESSALILLDDYNDDLERQSNPTPRPARSIDDIARSHWGLYDTTCGVTFAANGKAAALLGRSLGSAYEAFVLIEDGRLVIVHVDDDRLSQTASERKQHILAIAASVQAGTPVPGR